MKAFRIIATLVSVTIAVCAVWLWSHRLGGQSQMATPEPAVPSITSPDVPHGGSARGYVLVRTGFPPSVSILGYVMRSPLYEVTLPGVISTGREVIVKGVLPGQEETRLAMEEDWNGTISYGQCLVLLDHLEPVYHFAYTDFSEAAVKTLEAGDSIHIKSFYPMLKQHRVPSSSPEFVRTIKEQLTDKGWTPLMLAVLDDDGAGVTRLLNEGAAIEAKNKHGYTALMIAAEGGLYDMVLRLVERGANVNAEGQLGATPLILASQRGYVKVMELLLAKGANVRAASADGSTALHYAVCWDHLETVRGLLGGGAPLDSKSKKGWTPLMHASEGGRVDTVRYLLSQGAAVNARANDGSTALSEARSDEIRESLRAAGAN